MYNNILIPTDGSEHAGRAAEHALVLADAFDVTVHVITVVDLQAETGPFDAGGVSEEFVARLREQGREATEEIATTVETSERLRTAVIEGRPSGAILDYADERGVELVAMGTHGRTGVSRYVWGSVSERVVRKSDVPVLTVRATERSRVDDGYDDVLLPTDGSEAAATAVDHGLAIAEATGARVHSIHVVDVGGAASTTRPAGLLTGLESEGERVTEQIATRARASGLDAVPVVRRGSPAEDILAYVDDNDIDIVTMGTQGRTGLDRYLLGSTTERVVRRAEIPVVAVNSREEGRREPG